MVGLGLIKECVIGKRATQRGCQGSGSLSANGVQRFLSHGAEVRECLGQPGHCVPWHEWGRLAHLDLHAL